MIESFFMAPSLIWLVEGPRNWIRRLHTQKEKNRVETTNDVHNCSLAGAGQEYLKAVDSRSCDRQAAAKSKRPPSAGKSGFYELVSKDGRIPVSSYIQRVDPVNYFQTWLK
jgi:hypothetical protein